MQRSVGKRSKVKIFIRAKRKSKAVAVAMTQRLTGNLSCSTFFARPTALGSVIAVACLLWLLLVSVGVVATQVTVHE
eukprot:scaffold2103_cov99-Skeletonema_dohrnii-CCMP3373.AAC.8